MQNRRVSKWLLGCIALIVLLPTMVTSAQYIFAGLKIIVNNDPLQVVSMATSPVHIGNHQGALPITVIAPFPGAGPTLVFQLKGTSFTWTVSDAGSGSQRDGVFETEFPVYMFPAGVYVMTINGIDAFRIIIPEDYAPVLPSWA